MYGSETTVTCVKRSEIMTGDGLLYEYQFNTTPYAVESAKAGFRENITITIQSREPSLFRVGGAYGMNLT